MTDQLPAGPSTGDSCCEDGRCAPGWEFGLDYFLVWFKRNRFPGAAVTTGDNTVAVPGALGDPTTFVLGGTRFGDFPASAGKLTLRRWLGDNGTCSVDISYMAMEQRTAIFSVASDGSPNSPFIGRPFFNPVTGREDTDPRAIPNVMAGNANVNFTTRFQQAESNIRWYSGDYRACGLVTSFMVGARVAQLHELYSSPDTVTDLPLGGANAQIFTITDHFATYNDFYGAQIGFSAQWRQEWFTIEILGKVAGGLDRETSKISGSTTITNQNTGQSVTDTIGLYAQRSNEGIRRTTRFSYIPELDINLGASILERVRFKVGYNLLSMENVLRPGGLIDRNVNIQPLFAPAQLGVALPQYRESRTGFTMQGLSVGLEFLY